MVRISLLSLLFFCGAALAQTGEPDWDMVEEETLRHFRALPDEDVISFLDEIRRVVDDPAVEVSLGARNTRPRGESSLDTDAFRAIESQTREHYGVITLPTMSTGATDMAYLRAAGIQCYGIGPAIDREDAALGFGAHSDQERILISELHRFVRFHYDVVIELAAQ